MGGGILPCTIHNNKLYFLFGKENKYADTPGWSDFGGGKDGHETTMQTALREGAEELTGFLGGQKDIKKLLKAGTYKIDIKPDSSKYSLYISHLFAIKYDEKLPFYYNNNQCFLQRKLSENAIKKSRIFEKSQIKWLSLDDVRRKCKTFRKHFQQICKRLIDEKKEIELFIRSKLSKDTRKSRGKPGTKTRKSRR
jgi:hypothetical protein